jgi:hypothetical protein
VAREDDEATRENHTSHEEDDAQDEEDLSDDEDDVIVIEAPHVEHQEEPSEF